MAYQIQPDFIGNNKLRYTGLHNEFTAAMVLKTASFNSYNYLVIQEDLIEVVASQTTKQDVFLYQWFQNWVLLILLDRKCGRI